MEITDFVRVHKAPSRHGGIGEDTNFVKLSARDFLIGNGSMEHIIENASDKRTHYLHIEFSKEANALRFTPAKNSIEGFSFAKRAGTTSNLRSYLGKTPKRLRDMGVTLGMYYPLDDTPNVFVLDTKFMEQVEPK